jgi:phycocyanobilin lyase subunit alpha
MRLLELSSNCLFLWVCYWRLLLAATQQLFSQMMTMDSQPGSAPPTDTSENFNGGPQLTVATAIANLTQTKDAGDRYYAAWWLGRFRVQEPAAISALLVALENESDRNAEGGFPLRRNAARALGKLGDRRVVPALIACLESPDYYLREAAVQALESLAATDGLGPMTALLAGGLEAAVEIPGKPHLAQPYNAILEALGSLGNAQSVAVIEPFLAHTVPQVKNAAARALYQLTGDPNHAEVLVSSLSNPDLQLRRSILLDLGEIGYVPAAAAIARTPAENSIKLISLKGLLEAQVKAAEIHLSDCACEVMALMDSLL